MSQGMTAALKARETDCPTRTPGGSRPANTFILPSETIFGPLASRYTRELMCLVLRHQVCGGLLQQQQETNILCKISTPPDRRVWLCCLGSSKPSFPLDPNS